MIPCDFAQIVTQHYEPLYRFAFSLTRAEADAKDLTQQTFYIWATNCAMAARLSHGCTRRYTGNS
jgi:hypothetical protein